MAGTIVTDRIESDASFASKIELASPVLVSNTFAVKSTGGTGTFNIVGANTNTDRTMTLPDVGGNVVLDSATQTLTNKIIQGGALTLATAVTASGTSVDFTSIPSWVKRITVMFSGVSTNGSSDYLVRIGDTSIVTTGYLGASTLTTSSGVGTSNYTNGFALRQGGQGTAVVAHGSIVLHNISANVWTAFGGVAQSNSTFMMLTGGSLSLSGTLTQVRITTVNGTDTFDAGTINILYEG